MTLQPSNSTKPTESSDSRWYSTWQTNDEKHNYAWANEIIYFVLQKDGNFLFSSIANDLGYKWSGEGHTHSRSYMAGTWSSEKEDAKAAGAFILHNMDTQGEVRAGFLLGPDTNDRKNYGAWILVKADANDREELISKAKRHFSLNMCPGLGELIELSNGQFLRGFLHPEIVNAALPLLAQSKSREAVHVVFTELQNYIQKASGLSVTGAPLMKQAFAPEKGPLSREIKSNQEKTNQEYMRELFLGSLLIRNEYIKEFPSTTIKDALPLLMFASVLYKIVDQQRPASTISKSPL